MYGPVGYDPSGFDAGYGMDQGQGQGFFGNAFQGMGWGAPYGQMYSQMQGGTEAAATQFGGGLMGAGAGMVGTAAMLHGLGSWTAAPMMQAGGGLGMKALGTAWRASDPWNWGMAAAGKMGGAGWRAGRGISQIGRGLMGAGRLARGAGWALRGAGAVAGVGLGGGLGAIPVAAAMAASEAPIWAAGHALEGAQQVGYGQRLVESMGPAAGNNGPGAGMEMGSVMADMSRQMGVGMQDVASLSQQLRQAGAFNTTSNLREFKERFREVMDAVKEIAKTTQSTVEEAGQMFGELRGQGFYTTASIKAAASRTSAQARVTGMTTDQVMAIGGVGAQTARQMGMRGRFGQELMTTSVESVMRGMRTGAMSEEEIMEMGGPEAVGMQFAQKQMGFLGTARGRAMIAYSMGGGRGPDMGRLGDILGGRVGLEGMVTGAADRGLGVLSAAGSREAKEQFMPYASMAMVSMAAMQAKQFHGGATKESTEGMLRTMGMDPQQAELFLQQTMQMPKALEERRAAQQYESQMGAYEDLRRRSSMMGRAKTALATGVEIGGWKTGGYLGIEQWGGEKVAAGKEAWRVVKEAVVGGGVETIGGDIALAKEYSGVNFGSASGFEPNESIFGLDSSRKRIRDQYSDYVLTMDQKTAERMGYIFLGDNKAISRTNFSKAEGAVSEGMGINLSGQQEKELQALMVGGAGDLENRITKDFWEMGGKYTLGKTGGTKQDYRDWWMASKTGLIGRQTTFEQYQRGQQTDETGNITGLSKEEKLTNQTILGNRISQEQDQRMREMFESPKELFGGLGTWEAEKDVFKESTGQFLAGLEGRGVRFRQGFEIGSTKGSLQDLLSDNSKVRTGFDTLMRMIRDYPEDSSAWSEAYQALMDTIPGGETTPAGKAVRRIFESARGNPSVAKGIGEDYGKGKGTAGYATSLGRVAKAGAVTRAVSREKQAISSMLQKGQVPEDQKAAVEAYGKGLTTENRGAALGTLMSTLAKGGISEEEAQTLVGITGAAGGVADLQTISKGLQYGDTKDREKALELSKTLLGEEKFKELKLDKLTTMGQKEHETTIGKALEEVTKTAAAGFFPDEAGKSVEGVQTQYIEANTAFVLAVERFTALMKQQYPQLGITPLTPETEELLAAGGQ